MNLYIYKYNNYYNRIFKRENTLEDYGEPIHQLIGCKDFNPNDGVNTQHIFGSAANNYGGEGDYLIVADTVDNILSRWFIIETDFTRNGQWRLTIHRDLIADYYEEVMDSTCFIEKATLPADDPLLFNAEAMTVNQIKTSETLLKDPSGCAWLVGYYDKTAQDFKGTVPINIKSDLPVVIIESGSLEQWAYYDYTNMSENQKKFYGPTQSGAYKFVGSYMSASGNSVYKTAYSVDMFNNSVGTDNSFANTLDPVGMSTKQVSTWTVNEAFSGRTVELNYAAYTSERTQTDTNVFLYYDGKYLKDPSNGRIYLCKVETTQEERTVSIESGALYNNLNTILRPLFNTSFGPSSNSYKMKVKNISYKMVLTEQVSEEVKFDMSLAKIHTETSPWNIFAIPYGKIKVRNLSNEVVVETDENISMATAMAMQRQFPGVVHDIQLLPYCPIPELIIDEGEIMFTSALQCSWIQKDDGTKYGVIFNIPNSKFSFDLTQYQVSGSTTAIEKKVNNQCDKWRLTSPNYSNYFDFSVEKNGGVQFFNIDCEYKPFTPYIHINPNFSNLYGYDDNSPRGLVLGGDFSLSQVIDQWQQYQIQNKNFQNIFDRQIQNMEVQHEVGRIQDIVSGVTGTVQGAVSGATTGMLAGGGYGAIAGAVVGGAASMAGGIADYALNQRLRNETLDYTKDLFGYQLGNIQALPQTISKVSAFNNNNKIFPVLEYYTCTSREKQAFMEKIAWNGMTVMVIGKPKDYINNSWNYLNMVSRGYIKGKIIRIEDINDEYHLLQNIADEMNQGIYFTEVK